MMTMVGWDDGSNGMREKNRERKITIKHAVKTMSGKGKFRLWLVPTPVSNLGKLRQNLPRLSVGVLHLSIIKCNGVITLTILTNDDWEVHYNNTTLILTLFPQSLNCIC